MRRRSFIKGMAAAGASALVPSGITAALSSCSGGDKEWPGFDEVIDRSGTWSIKYSRATDGEIPMWIADMDFRTDPIVSEALRRRLDRDVMGYTRTPPEFPEAVAEWEKNQHGYDVDPEYVGYAPTTFYYMYADHVMSLTGIRNGQLRQSSFATYILDPKAKTISFDYTFFGKHYVFTADIMRLSRKEFFFEFDDEYGDHWRLELFSRSEY